MNTAQLNTQNPAIRRILSEIKKLRSEPSDDFDAHPVDDNLFDWHFVLRGPEDTPFSGGVYHGRIILPAQYPYKPPEFMFLCPTGRFEVGKKICLSISQHHPELWQPGWDIRTALTAIQSFMPTAGNGAIAALDYSDDERRRLAEKSREASKASLRSHGMLENFEEFLQRPRAAPAESPAAVGAASASAAAPCTSNSLPAAQSAGAVPAAAIPLSAEEAPSFGTPSPSPVHSASAGRNPASAGPSSNVDASSVPHPGSVQPADARVEGTDVAAGASSPSTRTPAWSPAEGREGGSGGPVATWAEAAVGIGKAGMGGQAEAPAAEDSSSDGLRQRKNLSSHAATSTPTPAWGGLHAAPASTSSGAGGVGGPISPSGAPASFAAAASRGGYVRENTPSEITTAPPTPQATPPATNVATTPATPNSGTLAGARFGAQQRGLGGAHAAGRNLHLPQAANATRGADMRNLPPPSEDELLLASIGRFLACLLFCLVARRGLIWAFPEADWHQVGLAIWQDLVSLSETAHTLYRDAQPGGNGGDAGADAGALQPEL